MVQPRTLSASERREQDKRTHSQGQYDKKSEKAKNEKDEEIFLAAATRWLSEHKTAYWREILDEERKEKPDSSVSNLSGTGNPDLLKGGYYEAGKSVVKLEGNTAKPVRTKDFDKGFDQDYGLAMDLLAYRGAETICINYDSPDYVKPKELYKLMDIAEKKGLGVKFDDNVKQHLAGLPQKDRDAIEVRLKEVNDAHAHAQSVREERKSAENERKLEKEVAQEAGKYEKGGEFEKSVDDIKKEEKLSTLLPSTTAEPLPPPPSPLTSPAEVKPTSLPPPPPPLSDTLLKENLKEKVLGSGAKEIVGTKRLEAIEGQLKDIDRRLEQVENARKELDRHLGACDKLLTENANIEPLGNLGGERRGEALEAIEEERADLEKRQGIWQRELQTLEGQIISKQENLVMPLAEPKEKEAKLREYKTQLDKIDGLQKQQEGMSKRLGNEGTALTDTKDKNEKVTEAMQAKQEEKQAVKRQLK